MRIKLKEPIGTLIQGSFKETIKKFKEIVEREKPSRIISVGDCVSRTLVESGIFPSLLIVDNKVMRKDVEPFEFLVDETLFVCNPQGTITVEAMSAIEVAVKAKHSAKIVVKGEEDLLALIAVLYAPEDSFVVYGQPRVGIVFVKVTQQKKIEMLNILNAMKTVSKD